MGTADLGEAGNYRIHGLGDQGIATYEQAVVMGSGNIEVVVEGEGNAGGIIISGATEGVDIYDGSGIAVITGHEDIHLSA